MRFKVRHVIALLTALGPLCLAITGQAVAGEVTLHSYWGEPVFTAAAGETNTISVSKYRIFTETRVTLTDSSNPVTVNSSASSACTLSSDGYTVTCVSDRFIQVFLEDANDTLTASSGSIANVYAGSGADTLAVADVTSAYGEGGRDTIDASGSRGTGNQELSGGEGSDAITGGSGTDYIYGGDGADRMNAGAGDDIILDSSDNPNSILRDSARCGAGDDNAHLSENSTTGVQDSALGCEDIYWYSV